MQKQGKANPLPYFFTLHLISIFLLVAFGSIVGFAEHLTVVYVGSTALAPRGYVVGIHFGYFPNTVFIVIVTHSTQRAV